MMAVMLNWSSDTAQARWAVDRLRQGEPGRVDAVVPRGFARYARILHPAWRDAPDEDGIRWSEVAAVTGGVIHPLVQFGALSHPDRGLPAWTGVPPQPSLSRAQVLALAELLAPPTPAGCWFCLWDGYGWLYAEPGADGRNVLGRVQPAVDRLARRLGLNVRVNPQGPSPVEPAADEDVVTAQVLAGPRVRAPGRDYLLYRGPIGTAAALCRFPFDQSPNLWWPDDRSWCVATDIDLQSSYLGGPDALIRAVLADDRLETLPAEPGDPVTADSDRVNEPPGRAGSA
jgi:hypothetical protein